MKSRRSRILVYRVGPCLESEQPSTASTIHSSAKMPQHLMHGQGDDALPERRRPRKVRRQQERMRNRPEVQGSDAAPGTLL